MCIGISLGKKEDKLGIRASSTGMYTHIDYHYIHMLKLTVTLLLFIFYIYNDLSNCITCNIYHLILYTIYY